MKQLFQVSSILIYKGLDWLKQESPFWWFIVQSMLWTMFVLITIDVLPSFGHKEIVLVFLGGLISGVGTRTSKKLADSRIIVNPDKFKQNYKDAMQSIADNKIELSKNIQPTQPVEVVQPIQPIQSNLIVKKEHLPSGQYVNEITFKDTIVLHHTAGGNYKGTIAHWLSKPDRVATHYLIDRDGTIVQTIPIECWAYHLGVSSSDNKINNVFKRNSQRLDKKSISIELCSYGQLSKKGDKFYTIYKNVIPEERVAKLEYSFRGFEYYEKYSEEQLRSLKKLLEQILKDHPHIPLQADYSNIFDINQDALEGKPGIFTHVSYRTNGKWDCYPDKDLIELLNSLSK